jgi:hypothetical protein
MIAKREEARREREAELEEPQAGSGVHPLDQVMVELEAEKKRKAHPALQWKSHPKQLLANDGSIYAKRQKRHAVQMRKEKIPALFHLCTRFLVDNFDCVEALGNVDSSIRLAIAKELISSEKLDAQAFRSIAEVGIETLELVDCSSITQEDLSDRIALLLPAGLRFLVLDQCGRCFGPMSVHSIINASPKNLFALAIGGAYLLKDEDAAQLIRSISPTLSSIDVKACPLIGKEFTRAISEAYSVPGSAKLLELAIEDVTLDKEALDALLVHPVTFQYLKSLSLRHMEDISEEFILRMLEMAGATLESLDLSGNHNLSDVILAGIRQHCSGLQSLNLEGIKQISSQGLEALFMHVPGMASPPMLRRLNLANCDNDAVTDDVIELVTQAAIKRQGEPQVNFTNSLGGLVFLSVQGSSSLTDIGLEHLVTSCGLSLTEIDLSFCTSVSDKGLGFMVDNCGDQLSNIKIWGNAQLSDEFLDGHRRIDDTGLEIAGAWMKKASSRTVR